MPTDQSDVVLPVLEAIQQNPAISQRALAARAGLSLTRTHFILRRLIDRGFVQVETTKDSAHKLGYLYLLTPAGLEEKARLSYEALRRAARSYQEMIERIQRVLAPAIERLQPAGAPLPVAVLGDGPVADFVAELVRARFQSLVLGDVERARIAIRVGPGAPRVRHRDLVEVALS